MKQPFGLEFEFASPHSQEQLARLLARAFQRNFGPAKNPKYPSLYKKHRVDLENFGYHKHQADLWGLEYDSSISTNDKCGYQVELITPPLAQNDFPAIKIALDVVRPDSLITKSCGLHCHVGVTNINHARRCALLWYISEPAILDVFPLDRSRNHYCTPLRNKPASVFSPEYCRRYTMINIESYDIRKTVEFRGHSGTLNYQKTKKWVLFCLSFVRLAYIMTEDELNQWFRGPYRNMTFNIFNSLDIKGTKTHKYFEYRLQHFTKGKRKRLQRENSPRNWSNWE